MRLTSSFTCLLGAVLAVPLVSAISVDFEKRAIWSTCNTWGSIVQGSFTVYQNLWGASSASSGSQCFSLNSVSGNNFAWDTTWTWAGGPYNVKSYDNISYNFATGVQLSTISSIPSTWVWSQTWSGSTPVNNVAYDLMTNPTGDVNGSHAYEIMIWLAAYGGAGPISSSGSAIATPAIAGHTWKLYDGYNGNMRVFSFVSSSPIISFSGDLMAFLNYLSTNNGLSKSQYLIVLQGGTEPFIGTSVQLTTTQFTMALNTGSPSATSTSPGVTSTSQTSSTTSGSQTVWGQCGGQGWTGPTGCVYGSTCTYSNPWYSQCLPN